MSRGPLATLRRVSLPDPRGPDPGGLDPGAIDHPDRQVVLDGAGNCRDVGGYLAADGRRIRWRRLFRADGLSSLSERDRGVIRDLGVATVIDLRTTTELRGGRFPTEDIPVGFHHLPLLDAVPDPARFEKAPGFLATQYQEMVDEAADQIVQVLSVVALGEDRPVIVHCTAGKDRTGVLIAVLLGVLGVPDDTIVGDYALSARAMSALQARLVERYPESRELIDSADELFSAAPATIAALLSALRARWGSCEAYLRASGADAAMLNALRRRLLD